MNRRQFVAGTAAVGLTSLTGGRSSAETSYPTRPVTLIDAFPPGGIADLVGRPFATTLEQVLGQPVVTENKPGAAGAVGAQVAANAKPDGYTMLVHITSLSGFAEVDRLFGRKPKFTREDFTPIARFTEGPLVLVANSKTSYRSLKDLIDDAKARPDSIVFSSSGLYGALHLPMKIFMNAADIKMRHLPTNGGGPATTAILGNNAQVMVSSMAAAMPHIRAGKLHALAGFSGRRTAALPDVPTLKELGFDVEFYLWVGLFAPKGVPQDILKKVREATKTTVASEKFQKAISVQGDIVHYMDQPEFAEFWETDAKRVEAAVRSIGRTEG